MFFASDARFPFTYSCTFCDCLRHILFETFWNRVPFFLHKLYASLPWFWIGRFLYGPLGWGIMCYSRYQCYLQLSLNCLNVLLILIWQTNLTWPTLVWTRASWLLVGGAGPWNIKSCSLLASWWFWINFWRCLFNKFCCVCLLNMNIDCCCLQALSILKR